MQEYFDPLILIITLTFFSSKIFINYKESKSIQKDIREKRETFQKEFEKKNAKQQNSRM